jgi:hypothetical protein
MLLMKPNLNLLKLSLIAVKASPIILLLLQFDVISENQNSVARVPSQSF